MIITTHITTENQENVSKNKAQTRNGSTVMIDVCVCRGTPWSFL